MGATREMTIEEEIKELEIPEEVKTRILAKVHRAEQNEIDKDFNREQYLREMKTRYLIDMDREKARFESEMEKQLEAERSAIERYEMLEQEVTILTAKLEVVEMIFKR